MLFIDFHTHKIQTDPEVTSIYNLSLEEVDTNYIKSFISAGIHPWDISDINNQFRSIIPKLNQSTTLAIGECGLDKVKGPDLHTQISVFKEHIILSEQYKKPLIIHCVKAYSEIIKLRKDQKPSQPWIFHGFNSSIETLNQAVKLGFYFSFGPTIIHHPKIQKSFINSPLNRVFLETDESDFSIKELYQKAAELKKIYIGDFQNKIKDNFNHILQI